MLICPNCGKKLDKKGNAFVCGGGHSFDLARQGYVNLLPVSGKKSENPGDNAVMTECRRKFLESGAYAPLRDFLCEELKKYRPQTVLDCGCAEGYYTRALAEKFPCVFGFDISKVAVRLAAGAGKKATYFVASAFSLPVRDSSCDALTRIFAPDAPEEFLRVLKTGGVFLEVVPGKDHLIELKEILYEEVRPNKIPPRERKGMRLKEEEIVSYPFDPEAETRLALYGMTPYAYKTGRRGEEKLAAAPVCPITAEFIVRTYIKDQ